MGSGLSQPRGQPQGGSPGILPVAPRGALLFEDAFQGPHTLPEELTGQKPRPHPDPLNQDMQVLKQRLGATSLHTKFTEMATETLSGHQRACEQTGEGSASNGRGR